MCTLLAFGALIFAAGFNTPHLVARAADDCAMIRSQIFGSGPNDMPNTWRRGCRGAEFQLKSFTAGAIGAILLPSSIF